MTIISAISQNGIIGSNGKIPWHLPIDLKRFRRLTLGNSVIMGRKAFESLGGRPLSGRENIVVSRNLTSEGVVVADSLRNAILAATKPVFIIGGAGIYAEAIPLADRMELTVILRDFEGDTAFPDFRAEDWRVKKKEFGEEGGLGFCFLSLGRKSA